MDSHPRRKRLKRQSGSIILHFDYDAFYASVLENETPAYRTLPLAVQQKQIIVTCNYEARRRGLYKLQLIKDAKRICPDVVIVLGEDLTRFRNASKELYAFLKAFSWNSKVERLGFDEVFMDTTDMIEYNVGLLNPNDLANSFFCLSKDDPTSGFAFNAAEVAGGTYPQASNDTGAPLDNELLLRLRVGSHLAKHLRHLLETQKGYTCTVGVSTNKLLSKLVGNLHKPNGQTTLIPPYDVSDTDESDNVTTFIDSHEVGKIPGIGFKLAQKLRTLVLERPPEVDGWLTVSKDNVLVEEVRKHPSVSAETLERILGGPGAPHGIGARVWNLLNGCDDTEVGRARAAPTQISFEDSYIRLDTWDQALKELRMLAESLINRMRIDLLEADEEQERPEEDPLPGADVPDFALRRWIAFPKTIRLSTRPRPPQNPDGSRNRSFARISRSAPMPNLVFNLKESVEDVADRLVTEALVPLFRRLHPEKGGWNLSLVNVAATNMVDAASDTAKGGVGRDIAKMFRNQDEVLKQWRVEESDAEEQEEEAITMEEPGKMPEDVRHPSHTALPEVPTPWAQDAESGDKWESDDEDMMEEDTFQCPQCEAVLPIFATEAHARWHDQS